MKRTFAAIAVGLFAVGAVAAPAAADGHFGYGKEIKDECGASFGQLRQLSPHPVTPSAGAKNFVMSPDGLAFHCA